MKTTLTLLRGLIIAVCIFSFVSLSQAQLAPGYEFRMIKPKISKDRSFEDVFIKIQFVISTSVFFKLTNKTNEPLEINWSSVSYVDPKGGAHRVIHEGVRYIERDRPQPPTLIPPGANMTEMVHPTDYIEYESGASGGWKMTGILDPFAIPDPLSGGETLGVFMPLTINGRKKNYSFTFQVAKETAPTPEPAPKPKKKP